MKSKLVAALIILLALGGGMMFYISPQVSAFFLLVTFLPLQALGVAGFWVYRVRPAAAYPLTVLLLAGFISGLANLDIISSWGSRLYLVMAALWTLWAAAAWLKAADIVDGLRLAGLIWPFIWLLAKIIGWEDHQNIVAFYSVIFLLTALTGRQKWPLIIHLLMLAYFGSRGAIIAAAVGGVALLWPFVRRYWLAYGLLSLAAATILFWIKPATAMIRLSYWSAALAAWQQSPWFGLGPGGLWARKIYPEGGLYIIHAHNSLVTCLAETGWLGLLAGSLAVVMLLNLRYTKLQAAIALGLAAWGMVDEPLFWLGPLLVSALIFSQLQQRMASPTGQKQDKIVTEVKTSAVC